MSGEANYHSRRRFFDEMLTVYGRNTVLEALRHPAVIVYRLHLADSNRPSKALEEAVALAHQKGAEILTHSRRELSRISRNGRQDQGVAADLRLDGYGHVDRFLENLPERFNLVALDRVTNPQNLGMAIRSVAAAPEAGLLYSEKGAAPIDPLAIKASAGAIFHARIVVCDDLASAVDRFRSAGARIVGLASAGAESIEHFEPGPRQLYLLGSESTGLSPQLVDRCDVTLRIPMSPGVDSLNVSVVAALVAFLPRLRGQ